MRIASVISLAAIIPLVSCTQAPQQVTPKTDEDKVPYAVGVYLASQMGISRFEFTDAEMKLLQAGVAAGARDSEAITPEEFQELGPKIDALLQSRLTAAMEREKKSGAEFLAKAAAESGAEKLPSGVVFKSKTEGTGASPAATDVIKMNYEGRLIGGKVFDSSEKQGAPLEHPLNQLIPCWTEGVQKMKVGGKAQLVCPSDQAYGDQGNPSIPGGSTLVFDVELLDIIKPDAASAAAH
jgi:FKBP-type peptidyl-prolyl cis-trans isomerase FkpA